MATGGFPGKTEEDFRNTCTLCLEPYRGRSPKILPCFHSFCLPCLTALEASVVKTTQETRPGDEAKEEQAESQNVDGQAEATEEEEKKAEECPARADVTVGNDDVTAGSDDVTATQSVVRKVFLCPACRSPVTVPEGGVACLQTNFYVDHEQDADKAPAPDLCDMCEEGNQQPASYVCQDCILNICRTCKRHHDMIAREHHVTSVSLGQPVKERQEKKEMCLVHRDQALCIYCRQCHLSICVHCRFSCHENHDTVDLARAVLEAREDMTSLVTKAQQQIQIVQSSLTYIERQERQVTRHVQEMTQQVHARFDQLLVWGRQSRDQLLEAVSGKEDATKSQLQAEKTATAATVDKLSALVSQAARAIGTDPAVVMLRNELEAALLREDKLDHHRQQADSKESMWTWRYDVTGEATAVQLDDVQAYMGRVVDGGGSAEASKRVTFRELVDRVDRLFTETSTNISSCKDDLTSLKEKEAELEQKVTSLSDDVSAVKKDVQLLGHQHHHQVPCVREMEDFQPSLPLSLPSPRPTLSSHYGSPSSIQGDESSRLPVPSIRASVPLSSQQVSSQPPVPSIKASVPLSSQQVSSQPPVPSIKASVPLSSQQVSSQPPVPSIKASVPLSSQQVSSRPPVPSIKASVPLSSQQVSSQPPVPSIKSSVPLSSQQVSSQPPVPSIKASVPLSSQQVSSQPPVPSIKASVPLSSQQVSSQPPVPSIRASVPLSSQQVSSQPPVPSNIVNSLLSSQQVSPQSTTNTRASMK